MGKTADDVMAVAKKYLGTKEDPPGSNNVIFNTDYYGRTVSGIDYPWCCVFVWDCFRIAGASELFCDGEKTAYCPEYELWALAEHLNVEKSDGQYGDIVTMDFGKGRASHIGFVLAKLSDGTYQTIEGNTSVTSDDNGGAVMVRIRPQNVIRYIFRPHYATARNYLRKGDQGDGVKRMQTMLIALGYSCGSSGADGYFGNATEISVILFQKDHDLTPDGLYGEKTSQRLEEVYSIMGKVVSIPNFTGEQLAKAVADVYKMAHDGHYKYNDSQVLPPCADHRISCDRLEARALWNLGMTEQKRGGETCGSFPNWFEVHGFKKITNKAQLKCGDMVFVDDRIHSPVPCSTWHMFTILDYDPKSGMCHKYDCGSDPRIQAKQPFYTQLEEWGEQRRFRFAYRTTYSKGALNGTYNIQSAVDRTFLMDVRGGSTKDKANVWVYKENGTEAQVFVMEHVENGYYRIINIRSGKCVDLAGAKAKNRQNIWQYYWNGTNAQLWKPVKNSDGSYTFRSAVDPSYVIDLRGAKAVNGQNIYIYKTNGTKAQKWFLKKIK